MVSTDDMNSNYGRANDYMNYDAEDRQSTDLDESNAEMDSDVEELFLDAMDEIQEANVKFNQTVNQQVEEGQIDSSPSPDPSNQEQTTQGLATSHEPNNRDSRD